MTGRWAAPTTGSRAASRAICTSCGHPFSFTPKLARGDVVGGQYEVEGCLAHGGLGWVYLGRDRNLDGNWVVLKGLLDSGDADAQAVAVAERGFLVEVQHPNVVRVYNSVEHAGSGYLVMEYVAGTSLGAMFRDRLACAADGSSRFRPLEAIEVVGDALPALAHLHRLGLAYCDFKPDNIIRTAATVKLIDLGGVYRMADQTAPIYGTPGFQAPEIAHTGPTVESDVYTVGRTLAVLTGESPLPGPSATGRASLDSFQRLVQRATHPDPRCRFHSIAEMIEQSEGVRRQLLSAEGKPSAAHVPSHGVHRRAFGRHRGTRLANVAGAAGRRRRSRRRLPGSARRHRRRRSPAAARRCTGPIGGGSAPPSACADPRRTARQQALREIGELAGQQRISTGG